MLLLSTYVTANYHRRKYLMNSFRITRYHLRMTHVPVFYSQKSSQLLRNYRKPPHGLHFIAMPITVSVSQWGQTLLQATSGEGFIPGPGRVTTSITLLHFFPVNACADSSVPASPWCAPWHGIKLHLPTHPIHFSVRASQHTDNEFK